LQWICNLFLNLIFGESGEQLFLSIVWLMRTTKAQRYFSVETTAGVSDEVFMVHCW